MMLTLDRGDRRTLTVTVGRSGTDPAGAVQFALVSGDESRVWFSVDPVVPEENPATYEITLAYGAEADFPTSHPSGTKVIIGAVQLLQRPPSGRDIDVQQVAWIRVRA